jgi:5-methylcytosine-specific restriction enzyme subunit McrC
MTSAANESDVVEAAVPLAFDLVPVRNVWLLFLYASGLAQFHGRFDAEIETSPDFATLIARLLCHTVEARLRRNLSFGYWTRSDVLRRVRGRIDLLETATRGLLRRGEVACRFEELTIDTPRNQFVRAALSFLANSVPDPVLAHRARALDQALARAGVSGTIPSRTQLAADQLARHQTDDRLMVSLARAVFDLVLPTEQAGARSLLEANRANTKFRKLFERAVGNFFKAELPKEAGWRIRTNRMLEWPVDARTAGIQVHLPTMEADIILDNAQEGRRITIDTKFTNILVRSQYDGPDRFKTGHIYQLYAYLRSQERSEDPRSLRCEGMLLYPAIGIDFDEVAEIQGHRIRFATVDLALPSGAVIDRLRSLPLEGVPASS